VRCVAFRHDKPLTRNFCALLAPAKVHAAQLECPIWLPCLAVEHPSQACLA
jgi:hypothetical protein